MESKYLIEQFKEYIRLEYNKEDLFNRLEKLYNLGVINDMCKNDIEIFITNSFN